MSAYKLVLLLLKIIQIIQNKALRSIAKKKPRDNAPSKYKCYKIMDLDMTS